MKKEACEITTETQTYGNIKKCSKIQENILDVVFEKMYFEKI